jgi:hypothetical protein
MQSVKSSQHLKAHLAKLQSSQLVLVSSQREVGSSLTAKEPDGCKKQARERV